MNITELKNSQVDLNPAELEMAVRKGGMSRREMLRRLGLASGAAMMASYGLSGTRAFAAGVTEVYPTSPLILSPFSDPLPIPAPLQPSDPRTWATPPSYDRTDSSGHYKHQVTPRDIGAPDPVYYKIDLQLGEHNFTSSKVQPIGANGLPVLPPDGIAGPRNLPASTIYGFNGTFPGPMIYAMYGQPACVRFTNRLHENPLNLDRNDFGAPDWGFLTHLHNAHTACESDGNPGWKPEGYQPQEWCDNLYLNYPAGGDNREKQSFFWFHDHRMHHTGANVYKGMVGLFPIYDRADNGNERDPKTYRLPGVPNYSTGRVDYDIPLAFYDCAMDDGVTGHADFHNGTGQPHPEWWGKTFFRHYPNHGFVGDIFTVNGTAYPVQEVKRRKYRFRFLCASIARQYKFVLMSSSSAPVTAASLGYQGVELQGQYRLPNGRQCMKFVQVAADGGLIPTPLVRDDFELWPAKRKEMIIDFTKYMDGTPTRKGDVVYLVNIAKMTNGRMMDPFDKNYQIPVIKFVIGDDAPDDSIIPRALREQPPLPNISGLPQRTFRLDRGGGGPNASGEDEWFINGLGYDPTAPLAAPVSGSAEVWTIQNGGGGWTHPMHLHFEEHRILSRNGVPTPSAQHPDDNTKEDVIPLGPSETVVIYRKFRTFRGPYVAHCHNLAHEDHNMMFGFHIA